MSRRNQYIERDQDKLNDPNAWQNVFLDQVTKRIPEERFAGLFDDVTGRPNAPIRVLVAMLILKEEQGLKRHHSPTPRGLLGQGHGDVGTGGIDIDLAEAGCNDQIHVFHGDGSQQGLVAHHHGTRETAPILEMNLHRARIGDGDMVAIGQSDFPFLQLLEIELNGQMLG